MDLYEESCVAKNCEGYIFSTNFERLFRQWFRLLYRQRGRLRHEFQKLDTSNMTRMITLAIDNFIKLAELLNKQTNAILSEKLTHIFWDSLVIASDIIMRLYERNRLIPKIYKIEQAIAQHKIEEIINKISYVESKPINYKRPVQHIITWIFLERPNTDTALENGICKMLLDSIKDLDAFDHEGNTLILFAASHMRYKQRNVSRTLNLINSLLHRGAYRYAKNNEGKTVIDYVTDFVVTNEENEEGQSLLKVLKSEVPPLQTLAAIKGKSLMSFGCIPDSLKEFVELH